MYLYTPTTKLQSVFWIFAVFVILLIPICAKMAIFGKNGQNLTKNDKNDLKQPFLQGFWHSIADVKENIKAAEDKNLDWIIWNILSIYELDYFTKLES